MALPAGYGCSDPVWVEFDTGTTSGSGARAVYALKGLLEDAGWTIQSSGDGLSAYSSSASVFSNGNASGANGFGNANAWFVIRSPGQVQGAYRYFCFQNIALATTTNTARVKYALAAFSGGSPSATRVPSATGEVVVRGGGTDASPTGQRIWSNATAGTNLILGIADSAAPYGWICKHHRTDATSDRDEAFWALDPLVVPDGVDHSSDADPYAIHFRSHTANVWTATFVSASAVSIGTAEPPFASDSDGTTYVRYSVLRYSSGDDLHMLPTLDTPASDVYSGNYPFLPNLVYRSHANGGLKGISSLFFICGFDDLETQAETNKTYTIDGQARALLRCSRYAMAWCGGATPGSGSWTDSAGELWAPLTIPSVAVDSTAPVVSIVSPPVLVQSVRKNTPIIFDVTDETALASVVLFASYPDNTIDLIHDGTNFRGKFDHAGCSRTVITGGYRYTILPLAGWSASPTIEFVPIDTGGNIGVVT